MNNKILHLSLAILLLFPIFPHPFMSVFSQDSFSIIGLVTNGSGIGIEGVTITAVLYYDYIYLPHVQTSTSNKFSFTNPPDSGQNFYTVQTDANGNFRLDSLPSGRFVVTANKAGLDFDPMSYTVTTTSHETICNFQVTVIPTIYSPITNSLSEETTSNLISVSNDDSVYTFSSETTELAQVDEGEIIMSGISPTAPEGFLRKVTSKYQDGENIILVTEPATLEDAFVSLSVDVTRDITPADITSLTEIPGVTLQNSPAGIFPEEFQFEMNSVVLFDRDGDLSTIHDQIIANGFLFFRPKIEFRIKIINSKIVDYCYSTTMSVQSGITISSKISINIPIKEIQIIPTIHLGGFMAGPIAVTPEINILLSISGSIDVVSIPWINHSTTFTAGAQLIGNTFRPISRFENQFSFSPVPSFSKSFSINVNFGPKLDIKLFKIFGPYIKPNLGTKLDVMPWDNPWLTLKGGLEVSVGVGAKVPIINLEIVDIEILAISKWYLLYSLSSGKNNQPNPPGNPLPLNNSIDQKLISQLHWEGGDPDGDSVLYDVYFEAGDSSPDILVAHNWGTTYFEVGPLSEITTYYWKVISRDEHGLETNGSVWRYTTMATDWEITASPTSDYLVSMELVSSDDIWAGGINGALIHWNGTDWKLSSSPTSYRINDIEMSSSGNGWIVDCGDGSVGNQGKIYHWDGINWSAVQDVDPCLTSLSIVPDSNGSSIYAAGLDGYIWHWDGVNWTITNYPESLYDLYDLDMISESNGWAVGGHPSFIDGGVIFHWDGSNWQQVLGPETGIKYYRVTALSNDDVWVLGGSETISGVRGIILHWNGMFWELVDNPAAKRISNISEVPGTNGNQLWGVGESGNIMYWNGTSWYLVNSPISTTLSSVVMVSSNDGWAVGGLYGTILRYHP